MHRCPVVSLVVLVFVVGAVGACSDDSEDGADRPWPGDGGPAETVDLGAGLVAEPPEGWEVGEITDATDSLPSEATAAASASGDCRSLRGWLGPGDDQPPLDLQLNSTGCRGLEPLDQIGNGYHGTYVTIDDVQDPTDVDEHEVTAGTLVTFSQDYFECTNECNDYDDHVGLLTLTTPPDPAFPTLTILDPKGEHTFPDLVALANAISPTA